MGLLRLIRGATACVSSLLLACGGDAQRSETSPQLCERAKAHVESCGSPATYRVDCRNLTPDVACGNHCDLETSCAYFRGESPSEGRSRSQCSSRCTCESALRRATECGLPSTFTCDALCNCPYYYDCADGIPAYAACRAQCPPWPG